MPRRAAAVLAVLLASPLPGGDAQDLPRIGGASTEVVRVDAVVTDGKGRYVTDLTAADFELRADGERQEVTNFQYVVTSGDVGAPAEPDAPPTPVNAPTQATARRTMAIVVDDISFQFETLVRSRRMLARLIDEQLGPGDMAAIVRTGGGMGNLQQFTSDKLLLKAAAAGIPFSLARMGARGPGGKEGGTQAGLASRGEERRPGLGPAGTPGVADAPAGPLDSSEASSALGSYLERSDRELRVHRAMATLTVVEGVMKPLARMPGRKSLVIMSEGFEYTDDWGSSSRVDERLDALAEEANRGSVVIYALDPGGLRTLGGEPGRMGSGLMAASAAQRQSRTGMMRLTDATGGLNVFDTNDLDSAARRVFDDQRGYYLLGYQPQGPSAPGLPRLHRLAVKVTRPGLRVRSRRAFASGLRDGQAPASDSFADALLSPFAATEIPVKLTVLFNHDPAKGAFLRCLVYMDARQMTLQEGASGARSARVEAGALAVRANGMVAQRAGGHYAFTVPRETADAAAESGLLLTLDLPVEAGAYQVRTAVRDVASARAGSASQFVIVPDMKKRPLAVSGLFMSGGGEPPDPGATPSVRRFRGGSSVAYAFGVYNARLDKADNRPRLAAALRLFREGRRVETMPIQVGSTLAAQDGVTAVSGALKLSPRLEPGPYVLQVVVKDELRPAKEATAVQWIDFEVAEPGR